jgi:hypothetical protein
MYRKILLGLSIVLMLSLAAVAQTADHAKSSGILCRDLETANADELLAMIDPHLIQDMYGGGVRLGESDCDVYPGQKVCDWKQTLEDDQMLDADHRLLYVLTSHQTGTGSWQNFVVFGCIGGQVENELLAQAGPATRRYRLLFSAPESLRAELAEYMKHLRTISSIDCEKVITEHQGQDVRKVAKDMNVLMGSVQRCRDGASGLAR